VNPIRDMEVIQTELRLKDIEWVEKALDGLKKTGRSLGSNSLADKAKKEEIVSRCIGASLDYSNLYFKVVVEKILKVLTVENKDIRKADWNNKEVHNLSSILYFHLSLLPIFLLMKKSPCAR